ncbi:MAG: hypothetical protein ACLQPD_18410 [Desulfomonilaceae bacterium]
MECLFEQRYDAAPILRPATNPVMPELIVILRSFVGMESHC